MEVFVRVNRNSELVGATDIGKSQYLVYEFNN